MFNYKVEKKVNRSTRKCKTAKKQEEEEEIKKVQEEYDKVDSCNLQKFSDFPLSRRTKHGLQNSGYHYPTEIQREAILFSLRGMDILGAAKTGSGKTLAFVVPVLECLWRQRWSSVDGLGALIISPTRELALQTYETFCKVGCMHDFSAALVIGGTDADYEKRRIGQSNLVVCTPGRLLQHMDENPLFDTTQLQIIVLDEADRILDLGFSAQLNAIIQNLPETRQTLLYSATQTKSVKDLARLSLKNPVYVSVHENSKFCTPERLKQNFVVCKEEDKLNYFWSFLRTHTKCKVLAFFTNCKQVCELYYRCVRFVYEAFRRLQPGLTVLHLHGSMSLQKRVNVFKEFQRKKFVVMFSTDIAARGLAFGGISDFPCVDWVIQVDCPADLAEYIHRSGRTARYNNKGRALLIVNPAQTIFIEHLKEKRIPISEIQINYEKFLNIQTKLQTFCSQDPDFHSICSRALVAYCKSLHFAKNKEIFNMEKIDLEALAKSMGLFSVPRMRFLRNVNKKVHLVDGSLSEEKQPSDEMVHVPDIQNETKHELDSDEDSDFLKVKKHDVFNVMGQEDNFNVPNFQMSNDISKKKLITRASKVKKMNKKNIQLNQKIIFTEDDYNCNDELKEMQRSEEAGSSESYIELAKKRLKEADEIDKKVHRERSRMIKRERLLKKKLKKAEKRHRQLPLSHFEEENGESDSASEAEQEPDLSWLPDPDKVYKYPEEEVVVPDVQLKRKTQKNLKEKEIETKKKKMTNSKCMGELTLEDQEAFALSLLEM
ncbi:putative ATP-dependent RNA helicase DDX10 [Trichinella patagoniensis]|uniref:ATP-dependent RNA helicase n=1 Tax=Trichinella patagoniensis TaxID=990121 RepID=A0A0V0ZCE6_9BILA|nr:putative ATP-dependent RNA helicase DDX10 [Trichinella patagoniensis]